MRLKVCLKVNNAYIIFILGTIGTNYTTFLNDKYVGSMLIALNHITLGSRGISSSCLPVNKAVRKGVRGPKLKSASSSLRNK